MMVSGAFAVTVSVVRSHRRVAGAGFALLTAVLLYALVANIVDKPDGIAISGMFIAGIVAVSLISRVSRTTELRVDRIVFDTTARQFITDTLAHDNAINIIANRREAGDGAEYAHKEREQRGNNPVPGPADVLFLEIDVVDPSDFSETLSVHGAEVDGYRILRAEAPAAPNAIAAILLALRNATGVQPHCYFAWAEEVPCGTCSATSSWAAETPPPSPARSSAATSRTPSAVPASTSAADPGSHGLRGAGERPVIRGSDRSRVGVQRTAVQRQLPVEFGPDLVAEASGPGPADDQLGEVVELDVLPLGHFPQHVPSLVGRQPPDGEKNPDRLVDHGVRAHGVLKLRVLALQHLHAGARPLGGRVPHRSATRSFTYASTEP